MSKDLKYLVIHCTATPEGRDVTAEDIRQWHIVENKWRVVGYHYLIQLDGTIVKLHAHNADNKIDPWEVTNGVRGFNAHSLHIVYAGGCGAKKDKLAKWYPSKDTRTKEQIKSLTKLVKQLAKEHHTIKVCGHNQLANKSCPSFDVKEFCKQIKLPSRNIYNY